MISIKYGDTVGVFSENGRYRLDIGTGAMKKNTPADHDTWATRLVVKRLEGTEGKVDFTPVFPQDVVGIFSENELWRLDIGTGAMKRNTMADHDTWATRLVIRRLNGPSSGDVCYGHVVGIFSEDGRYRLDIGTGAVKKNTPSTDDTWATRLRIRGPDPIAHVKYEGIDYDLENAQILEQSVESMYREEVDNPLDTAQTSTISGKVSHTVDHTWTNTESVKLGVEVGGKAGIPFVAEGTVKVSTELSYIHGDSRSSTDTKEWGYSCDLTVPPHSKAAVLVVAHVSKLSVPYTKRCVFVHKSAKEEPVVIPGVYTGNDAHDITVTYGAVGPGDAMGLHDAGVVGTAKVTRIK